MSKTLVLYYSYFGNTRKIAETIAESLETDIREVKIKNEKKSQGLLGKIFTEMRKGSKIELEPIELDFSAYDTVFLGSPIWGGGPATPIDMILRDGTVSGKKIAWFYCTGGESDSKSTERIIEKGKAKINKHNSFVSAAGFARVLKRPEQALEIAVAWAKEATSLGSE